MPFPPARARVRIARLALAAAAALAVPGVAAGADAASAAPGCSATYTVTNAWDAGFTAAVHLVNTGDPVSSWQLTFTFPAGQQVTQGWSATWSQAGAAVTATNAAWNGELGSGQAVDVGFNAAVTGSNPAPTDFAVNGVSCAGSTPSPSPSPSPSASPSPSGSPSPSVPPSPSPSDTPPAPGVLQDGFENPATTGPGGLWSVVTPSCSGTGAIARDTAVAHTGSASLRVDGGAGYCNHVFAATAQGVSSYGPTWFGRLWVRHDTPLPTGHVTFATFRDAADGGKDLRLGGQNGALQWNRESDDATLPEQSPAGVALSAPLPTGTWTCVEFAVDGAAGTLTTWVNGQQVPGLTVDGTPTPDVDRQWLAKAWRPALVNLQLGWESYSGGADTVWFDDVALGSSRIGC